MMKVDKIVTGKVCIYILIVYIILQVSMYLYNSIYHITGKYVFIS